jgi:predicted HicB family RNase H-like nuclease
MAATKRKFMAVTMLPELYARAVAAAAERDMPVTAWVREVVIAELKRQGR